MINFHGVHKLELFIRVLLKNHNIANNYRTNVIEVLLLKKSLYYNKIIKTYSPSWGCCLLNFIKKRKQQFLFLPWYQIITEWLYAPMSNWKNVAICISIK